MHFFVLWAWNCQRFRKKNRQKPGRGKWERGVALPSLSPRREPPARQRARRDVPASPSPARWAPQWGNCLGESEDG